MHMKKRARVYRSDALSLSPLNLVLTKARRNLPPGVRREDANEKLASKLIEGMKLQIKKHGLNETAV
jgi:hypothetical protein